MTGSDGASGWTPGGRARAAALLGGLLASGLTWGAGEAAVGRFRSREVVDALSETADLAAIDRASVLNAALSGGAQGALLGLALGLAGGAARGRARASAAAGLAGLGLGGLLGGLGSFGAFTAFFAAVDPNSPDLVPSLLAHAGVASLVGGAGGAAFGLGAGRPAWRSALGGAIGGAIGAGLYEVLGAVLFPVDRTGDPVAASAVARLAHHALVDLPGALGAAALVESRPR